MQSLTFGPCRTPTGILFRLWAPLQAHIFLKLDDRLPLPMVPAEDGWHQLEVEQAGPGMRYAFVLEDGTTVPDPASRFQPEDAHKPSEVIDEDAFAWSDGGWRGRPWEEMVIYELHVGAFTPEGTFRGVIDRLDHLEALGVTALQLMPVSDFPGTRGWGYDGVLPYAPESSYGRPDDLKALVDAAHARGICVFLDVVYNHFGPDGNYVPGYAPLFTERHKTPWGSGVNYDGDGSAQVRAFVVENALYWINGFHIDGLRLDAVHAIEDESAEHLLAEIARRVKEETRGRHVHLVVENEDNNSLLLARDEEGEPTAFTAQWNDDIHHVLHVAASGEDFGYYADYADGGDKIGRALSEGFVYQGEVMPYRGSVRGRPSAFLPPTAFISFIQNHDQIGNRAYGDRLSDTASPAAVRAIAAVYLLAPQIPMIFMGEEWACAQPFPYFCDFHEDLNEIVRQGRRKELSRLPGFDAQSAAHTPDPTATDTFLSAKLDWNALEDKKHAPWLRFYRQLTECRRADVIPRMKGLAGGAAHYAVKEGVVQVAWKMGDGSTLALLANLCGEASPCTTMPAGKIIWAEGALENDCLDPWSVLWTVTEGR